MLENIRKIKLSVEKEQGGHYSTAKILDIDFLPEYEKNHSVNIRNGLNNNRAKKQGGTGKKYVRTR